MQVETLAFGFGLIEGPRGDAEGGLYFSDVTNGGVRRLAPNGDVELVVRRRRGVGGIALHADGGIVISGRDICHVKAGETRVLFERPEGVGGFNDLITDAAGRVYTGTLRSDPFSFGAERVKGEAYRIDGPAQATRIYGDVGLSNGMGFSPDGRRLYHSDTSAGHVIAHDVTPEGELSERGVLAEVTNPDGLAVDAWGGVWVACYGDGCVVRITPQGELDRRIEVPAKQVTSLCFGTDFLRDLYIVTADNTEEPARGGTIFRVRSEIPGLPVPPARI